MEEAPSSSDSLQPQDLSSTCSLPNIFTEECLLKASPIDALRVVQTPGWFVSPGTSNGILLPENISDPLPLPTDQIQPDNAFSNTTVTLSYVSRSHVFSEHSPVYGVPSAFLRAYDASKLATDAGDVVLPVDVDQHCLQQVSVPVEQFSFMTPAQVVENMAALCYLQQPPDLQDVENLALETLKSLQADPTQCRFPISMDELQNGAANGLWNIGPFEGGFPEDSGTNVEGLHRNGNPELVFLISRSEEPVVLPNEQGAASFAISLNPEFIRPLDPSSPSEEQTGDDFTVPQSGEVVDGKQQEEVHLTTADAETESSSIKPVEETESVQVNGESTSVTTKKTPERKTLPPRAGRGMRLEAIVQNIQPFRCKSTRVRVIKAKSNKNLVEKTKAHLQKEQTEIRRSSRHKATVSTSTPTKTFEAFLKCTKTKSSKRMTNSCLTKLRKMTPKQNKASKRRRKKHKGGHTSFFSPQEPEIKLKCLNHKEEKKEVRDDTFAPYVHVHLNDFSSCTVVNYPEDKRGKRPASMGFVSGVMPVTPGLQYGRVCVDSAQRDLLICSLCGGSANAMDLGDLHGPYYPEGFKSTSKVVSNQQEEDNSDSDSSFRGKPVGGSFCRLSSRWTGDDEPSSSPASRTDSAIDWYSPPVVPLDESEHWLHEECAIWSTGVFLVRGKLYGLENAAKLAKASVCSTCQKRGATMGCVSKGCLNKYHYTCALQSGCVLNEDNFSMKCRKHKNKSIKGSSDHQINR